VDDDASLVRLRSMQRAATGLLLAAAAVYAVARAYESRHPALGYLRAFCEAAMVGGLADWFAVTALFRHPLACCAAAILPATSASAGSAGSWSAISCPRSGRRQAGRGGLAGPWRAGWRSGRCDAAGHAAPAALNAVATSRCASSAWQVFDPAASRWAPLAADVLETLTAGDRHQELVDEVIAQTRRLLSEAEPALRARVREKTAWLFKKLGVDEAISDRLIAAAQEALAEAAADPTHAWRQRFTDLVREYVVRLRTSAEYARRAEALKQSLDHPVLVITSARCGMRYARACARTRRARIRRSALACTPPCCGWRTRCSPSPRCARRSTPACARRSPSSSRRAATRSPN
jgi:hypothetical protein